MESSLVTVDLLLELALAVVFARFAVVYAGERRFDTRRVQAGLVLLAALGTAAVLTNPLHGLVFADVGVAREPFTYVWTSVGPVGWLLFATNTGLLLLGGVLVLRSLGGGSFEVAWRPAAVVASGLALAVVVGVLSMLNRGPVAGYDYSAAGANYFVLVTTVTLLGQGLRRLKTRGEESVIAAFGDPIVILDDGWRVVECNDAAEELLPGARVGRPFDALLSAPVERPRADGTTTTELSLPFGRAGDDGESGRGRDADDYRRHFIVTSTAVTTDGGDVIGYTVQFADVTDLRHQIERLEVRNEQLDRFTDAITADLREPLGTAAESTTRAMEILETAPDPGAVDRSRFGRYLDRMGGAFSRMEAIIDDVLRLARGEQPEPELRPVSFEEAVTSAWVGVDADGTALELEADGQIRADPALVERLLESLLRRADDARPADGAVRVALEADGFTVTTAGGETPETSAGRDGGAGDRQRVAGGAPSLGVARQRAAALGWTIDRAERGDEFRITVTGCDPVPAAADPTEVRE